MSSEIILLWFVGSVGIITGVLALNFWLDRRDRKKRERTTILKRLEEI